MSKEAELIVQGRNQELWQRCCGFIDLSLKDYGRSGTVTAGAGRTA